jgi:RNA polymerase-binding transcription factor DksA
MFNYVSGPPICDSCKKAIEESFQNVKQYIEENPRASLQQIAEENGVTTKQIQQWIREERLMFSADSPLKLYCEKCGAPITTGRFCVTCKGKMADNLTDTFAKPKVQLPQHDKAAPRPGMRFLDP